MGYLIGSTTADSAVPLLTTEYAAYRQCSVETQVNLQNLIVYLHYRADPRLMYCYGRIIYINRLPLLNFGVILVLR